MENGADVNIQNVSYSPKERQQQHLYAHCPVRTLGLKIYKNAVTSIYLPRIVEHFTLTVPLSTHAEVQNGAK